MSKTKRKATPKKQGPAGQNRAGNIEDEMRLAVQLYNQQQFQEAGKICRATLDVDPNNPDALHLSGLIAFQAQNFDVAKKFINQAIAAMPAVPAFHISLGRIHLAANQPLEAEKCFKTGIELKSDSVEGYFQLGNLFRATNRENEAIEAYRTLLRYDKGHAAALNNLGNALKEIGRLQEAIDCYKQALAVNPDLAEAYTNMGNAYKDLQDGDQALLCYRKAIEIRPAYADPYNNIGYLLQQMGRLSESLPFLEKALELKPGTSEILHNIGNAYKDMGDFPKAIEVYQKALQLKPGFTSVHSNILFAMNYAEDVAPQAMHAEAQKWWQQQAAHLAGQFTHNNRPDPTRRLKIGFVSADLCLHSVSFFFRSLLRAHNRDAFEICCYADVRKPDAVTAELRKLSEHWVNILGLSDEAVARKISEDGIDILVDLAGHTAGNRLLAFARKPAPIQVSWLGYPNTTGMPVMDYRITDPIADPAGLTDDFYSEKLFRLPTSFLCYSPEENTPAVAPLPALKNQVITFGSFNNPTKTSPGVLRAWARILSTVPDSRLLLKGTTLADAEVKKRFLASFTKYHIDPDRIVLRERTATMADHLALYNEIDIGLDPFPYNGTTTTCEALWMGVPVIVLAGQSHCSRVGCSILVNTGLQECIAESAEQYIAKAVALTADLDSLSRLRTSLRQKIASSSLCNQQNFAREMEAAVRQMWQAWCARTTGTNLASPPLTPPDVGKQVEQTLQSALDQAIRLNEQGEELFGAGDLERAATLFRQTIDLAPRFGTAYNNLGVLHYQTGNIEEAITSFRMALEINHNDTDALQNMSDLLQSLQAKQETPQSTKNSVPAKAARSNAALLDQAGKSTTDDRHEADSIKAAQTIWLSSFPRSGNTMLRTILWHCFGLHSASVYPRDLGNNPKLESQVGHIEHTANGRICFPPNHPHLVKTHEGSNDDHPAIYVVRDGRAACVSMYHFYKKQLTLEDIIIGNTRFGSWQDHVQSWHPWDRPQTLFLRYEEMVSNLPQVLIQLSQFLACPVIRMEIPKRETIAKDDGQWVRKKTDWRELMTDDLMALFDQHNGAMMKKLGYAS